MLDGLETDVEAVIVNRLGGARAARDRPDRRVLPARGPRAGELGGDLRRAADRERRRRLLRGAAGAGAVTEVSSSEARLSTPELDLEVVDAAVVRRTWRLQRCASRFVRPSRPAREVYMVALTTLIHIDPGLRVARNDETRELLVDLFGEPERWAATTTSIVLGAGRDGWCRPSPARPSSSCPVCRATTTSRWPPRSTSTRCRTARCRSASTSAAGSSTAATTAGCRS